jgi:DNA invertase Pin-like site-specific DNA recombinase
MSKIKDHHLQRIAIVYPRQSSPIQVRKNIDSKMLQYALTKRAKDLGWQKIEVIDPDLGISASAADTYSAGFERIISLVALGQVGIVLGRELSRLSRNDCDWARLIEICGLFGTLVADEDHLYNPNDMDDQLMLGIKGTMSKVELGIIKMRMQAGKEASAARGTLRCRLPTGYVYDADGRPVKDPNERTRDVVQLVFRKFEQLQNGHQLFIWFHDERVEMPVYHVVCGRWVVGWRIPTMQQLVGMIKNPFYTGAYVYGRRPLQPVMRDGKVVKRPSSLLAPEQCRVFIADHHEAYISQQQYQENVQMLARNRPRTGQDEAITAARSGAGLLVGLLRCGHCGRKLAVAYIGKNGTTPRYLCRGAYWDAGDGCLSFAGTLVEKALQQQVLASISPMGIEASVLATQNVCDAAEAKLSVLRKRAEQLRYEASRAFDQYDASDPKNRLVNAELERRWNDKLVAAEQAEKQLLGAESQNVPLDAKTISRLTYLGKHFEQAWTSSNCSAEAKKRIIRTVIEEITVRRDERELVFIVRWAGGVHAELRFERPAAGSRFKTSIDAMGIIRKMAPRYDDETIAGVLGLKGMRTGRGNKWNKARVKSARHRNDIAGKYESPDSIGLLTMHKAVIYCGISIASMYKLIRSGLVHNEQTVPNAPLEIRKSDLDSPAVQQILRRLRATRRLDLQGGSNNGQMKLFE